MYLTLNKRQKTGKLIAYCNFKDNSFVNLIKLYKPYKDGTAYCVYETTNNAFMSNGLFKDVLKAFEKYNLMVKNGCSFIGMQNSGLLNRIESKIYLNS